MENEKTHKIANTKEALISNIKDWMTLEKEIKRLKLEVKTKTITKKKIAKKKKKAKNKRKRKK